MILLWLRFQESGRTFLRDMLNASCLEVDWQNMMFATFEHSVSFECISIPDVVQ